MQVYPPSKILYKFQQGSIRTLVLRQPVATDLRSVICALKVASNFDRIVDYAKNIAKRTIVLADTNSAGSAEKTIKRMADLVQKMVTDGLKECNHSHASPYACI